MKNPWDFHRSSPIVHEGIACIGSENGILFGIDIITGKEKLKNSYGQYRSYTFYFTYRRKYAVL
jgi:hypothetical protein